MSVADTQMTEEGLRSPLKWRQAWLTIDQNPVAQSFAASWLGKLIVQGIVVLALAASFQFTTASLALIGLTLFAIALLPTHRLPIMVGASLFYLFLRPFRIDGWSELVKAKAAMLPTGIPQITLQFSGVAVVVLFGAAFLYWQRENRENRIAKRPVLALMSVWCALLLTAYTLPQDSGLSAFLWAVVGVFISSFWYLAYAAADQKTKDATPTLVRAGFLRAFWGGSATPIGKSFGYLNKFDSADDTELAITRLKGMKLAVWALILTGTVKLLDLLVADTLAVPTLQHAIVAQAAGQGFSFGMNWASLISNYFADLLIIAIWGHFIVAVVRMVGYRIPRNTRNPLASRTLAEFWNRYFFYFKELLVDFFFYPAFVRYFKKNTKMRVAFATFCAAGLGNFLYHFTRETYVFADLGFIEALPIFYSAMFYSVALATGLIISQWRGAAPKPEHGFFRYEILPRLNVCAFFCFLKIFDDIFGEGTLADRGNFALSLFGL